MATYLNGHPRKNTVFGQFEKTSKQGSGLLWTTGDPSSVDRDAIRQESCTGKSRCRWVEGCSLRLSALLSPNAQRPAQLDSKVNTSVREARALAGSTESLAPSSLPRPGRASPAYKQFARETPCIINTARSAPARPQQTRRSVPRKVAIRNSLGEEALCFLERITHLGQMPSGSGHSCQGRAPRCGAQSSRPRRRLPASRKC